MLIGRLPMPHTYTADRRHRVPKRRYMVPDWQAHEGRAPAALSGASLRLTLSAQTLFVWQRGSLTIRFTEDTTAAWRAAPRTP